MRSWIFEKKYINFVFYSKQDENIPLDMDEFFFFNQNGQNDVILNTSKYIVWNELAFNRQLTNGYEWKGLFPKCSSM